MAAARLALDGSESSFVGREELLVRVPAALASGRSVVVSGPPGVGKTRLVAECLKQLSDSPIVVVPLADVSEVERFVARVAEAAGATRAPAGTGAEAEARLARFLALHGAGVFVLDGFERLPPKADALVGDWIRACRARASWSPAAGACSARGRRSSSCHCRSSPPPKTDGRTPPGS